MAVRLSAVVYCSNVLFVTTVDADTDISADIRLIIMQQSRQLIMMRHYAAERGCDVQEQVVYINCY